MAKTATYSLINSTTLESAQSSVTFSSIPSTFTDLVLVLSGTATAGGPGTLLRFNSDTTSNYSFTFLTGDGTSASSGRSANQTSISTNWNGVPHTSPNANLIQIMDYANATTFKTILSRSGQTFYGTDAIVGLWRKSPEIINSITLTTSSSTYASGSTFKLYGIEAGNL